MIAPVPHGFTGHGRAPGSFTIPEDAYRAYVRAVLAGLAKSKFKNILQTHGGGQTAFLVQFVQEAYRDRNENSGRTGGRIAAMSRWKFSAKMAVTEQMRRPSRRSIRSRSERPLSPEMAMRCRPNTEHPFPSTIMLYKEGQGYPSFDPGKRRLFHESNTKLPARFRNNREWTWRGCDRHC
jgi:creatinine amidohydrolase